MMARGTSLLLAVMLGGCATVNYPALYTAPSRDAEGPALTAAVLEDARQAQLLYAARYQSAARTTDLSNIPLIGAAAAAAALLFGKGNNDAIFAIGLGSATYAAGRATLAPPGMASSYMQGHSGLGCIRRYGTAFAGSSASATRDALFGALSNLRAALIQAELASLSSSERSASADEIAVFKATQLRLRDQIVIAKQLEATGERELVAFSVAPETFVAAVEAVHLRVAMRGREGREVDFAALTQALLASASSAIPKPAADTSTPMVAASAVDRSAISPQAALIALHEISAQVRQRTPPYIATLAKVAICAS